MLDDLIIQPEDSRPIYQQLELQLLRFIRAGRLQPGQALPSVRVIAAHLALNPMTVSKSVNRLVEQGWLQHRRGKPTCVAESLPNESSSLDVQLEQDLKRVINYGKQIKLSKKQLLDLCKQYWDEV
ncbi:GntR family transcriptional regulator [Agaribacterium sp. ZY112]|uniref:GntR family transcriptional regulator n=1 Tax=Agaribacterium sp. ZY112 TaxID=3233574 RepID=UPI003523BA39